MEFFIQHCAPMVVNSLLENLNKGPFQTVGYADDIVILVNGKFPETVSSTMQNAMNIVEKWCKDTQLTINPNKTTVIPFTRKKDLRKLITLSLFSKEIQ